MILGLFIAVGLAQTAPDAFGRFDVDGVTVLRPIGPAFGDGFDNVGSAVDSPFGRAVIRALEGRETAYDFAMVFLGQGLPRQIEGAFAFNQTHNRDVMGTGRFAVDDPRFAVRSALYMNRTSVWPLLDDARSRWVFNHEIGHHWLAYPAVDLGGGRSEALLGRQRAHWTYFLHTGNAPMEGNAWIDNGDGTFTTDPEQGPGGFSDLELYLMGLVEAGDVSPFFLIEPDDPAGRIPSSTPDHYRQVAPTTVTGSRIELTVDDIIASNGAITPGPGASDTEFSFLTILVVGPHERIDPDDLARIDELHTLWAEGFAESTRGLASVGFDAPDEGLSVPPIGEPAWIPEAAR